MDILTLKTQIQTKNLDKVFYFTGDEWKIIKLYINKIAEVAGMKIENMESVANVVSKTKQGTLLTGVSKCYVVYDDKNYMAEEKVWGNMENVIGNNILIVVYHSIDKRSKFFKDMKDRIVVFDKMEPAIILKYCKKEIDMSDKYLSHLITICENDYGRTLLEINKIKHYADHIKEVRQNCTRYDSAYIELLDNGSIAIPAEDAVFKLVDAIFDKNATAVYEKYAQCVAIGESPLVIITNIFNTAKYVLQIQTHITSNIEQETGLNFFLIKNNQNKCGRYSDKELMTMMRLAQETESRIKQGTLKEDISVEYLLANILGGMI